MASHCDEPVPLGDVENQLSPSPRQSSPNTTSPAPNQLKVLLGDGATKAGKIIIFIIICLILPIVFPFALAYVIVSVCLFGSNKRLDDRFPFNTRGSISSSNRKGNNFFRKMQEFETTKEKILRFTFVATTRLGCLALSWLVVNLCVPNLASLTLISYPLWKWSLLIVVVFLGYPSAALIVFFVMLIVDTYEEQLTKKPNLERFYTEGLQASFYGLLYFALILLMWLLYFRTDRGLNPSTKLDKLGTWTFVSLLVAAFLWVLKSAAMLKWKAKAVYKRFKDRIVIAGFQLYFLQIVMSEEKEEEKYDRDLLLWTHVRSATDGSSKDDKKSPHEKQALPASDRSSTEATTDNNNNLATDDKKSPHISISTLSKNVTIYQLDYIGGKISSLPQLIEREDEGISNFVAGEEKKFKKFFKETGLEKEKVMKRLYLSDNEVDFLLKELNAEELNTYDAFWKWVVDAQKNCLSVGYTLKDAYAMVSALNEVIIGFLAVMTIPVWLLVTELATTSMIVLIGSPILALSFMFGDTCKTFFQGVIFSFVTHPYNVGDRCIIDEMELEVKRIGILTTTFQRIGANKEKVMYPNASLATKLIINLEGESDPNDIIELMVDSSTKMFMIQKLENDLRSFFRNQDEKGKKRHGSYGEAIYVTLEEIGRNIKVRISFTHMMDVQDVMTHSQCLQKKNNQRSKLLRKIKEFLEKHKIELATS